MINLRHLWLPYDMKLSREIGQLSSLRTLYPCNVENNDSEDTTRCGIEVLEGLNLLTGELGIDHLRNVISGIEAQRANLMGKKNLTKIFLSWHMYESAVRKYEVYDDAEYTSKNDEAVLEALQPHSNLKSLIIDQYFGVKLPWWMGDPSCLFNLVGLQLNLVGLQLNDCPKCEQLVGFGKLPSLKVFNLCKMHGIKCLGNEFYYNNNNSSNNGGGFGSSSSNTGEVVLLFPSLKELELSDMGSLEEWVDIPPPTPTVVATCFPFVEKIDIYECPMLRITPTRFPSLKKLNLQMINEKVVAPLITTNLNSLHDIQLTKITELRFLPQTLLQGSNVRVLKVIDCLDFQGFLPSKEKEEEEEEEQSSSLQLLSLLRLPILKFLPDIRSFTSLENLYIRDCKSLKPIPEDIKCLPSSIKHLKAVGIQNVKEVKDFEWQK